MPHLDQGAQAAAERKHGAQRCSGRGIVQQRLHASSWRSLLTHSMLHLECTGSLLLPANKASSLDVPEKRMHIPGR